MGEKLITLSTILTFSTLNNHSMSHFSIPRIAHACENLSTIKWMTFNEIAKKEKSTSESMTLLNANRNG